MCTTAESDDIVVNDMAEEEVEGNSKDPSQQDLIVGMHSMVDPAEGDHEASEQGYRERDHSGSFVSLEPPADQVPDRQVERHRGD